jgi:hypothetical protein
MDTEVSTGCVGWSADTAKDDFIFYCPLCASETGTACAVRRAHPSQPNGTHACFQLTPKEYSVANLQDIWFRFDPAVLVVAITWHQTEVGFGEYIHTRLSLAYANNQESVCLHCVHRQDPRLTHRLGVNDGHLTWITYRGRSPSNGAGIPGDTGRHSLCEGIPQEASSGQDRGRC